MCCSTTTGTDRVQDSKSKAIIEVCAAQVGTYDQEEEGTIARRRADKERLEVISSLKADCELLMKVKHDHWSLVPQSPSLTDHRSRRRESTNTPVEMWTTRPI